MVTVKLEADHDSYKPTALVCSAATLLFFSVGTAWMTCVVRPQDLVEDHDDGSGGLPLQQQQQPEEEEGQEMLTEQERLIVVGDALPLSVNEPER